ncbi:MAG: hypothetical protein V3V74_07670 [Nitrosomonadaceae bacterium]
MMKYLDQDKWDDDDDDDMETDLYNQQIEKHNKEVEEIDTYNKKIDQEDEEFSAMAWEVQRWTLLCSACAFLIGWFLRGII